MNGAYRVHDDLLLVVGLTGAGKSTLLRRLVSERAYMVLPNRRELADRIAIPTAQTLLGEALEPVTDRLERFRLTARYRAEHSGGLAHALAMHLAESPRLGALVFESLRGSEEVRYALDVLPRARLLMLDAPPEARVERLLARGDAFDIVDAQDDVDAIPDLAAALAIDDVALGRLSARAEAHGGDAALARVLAIIAAEHRNYGGPESAQLLRALPHRALVVDAGHRSSDEVADAALAWI